MRQWLYIYLGLMAYCLGCLIVVIEAFKGRNMKNKIRIAGAILATFLLAGFAVAEEVKDYHLQATVVEPGWGSKKFKITPSEVPKGIYVVVTSGWSTLYPNLAEIIKSKFKEKGFVVTDKIDEADLGINFFQLGIPFSDIEKNTTSINKEHVGATIGAAILTGGISLIATGIQMSGKSKGRVSLTSAIYKAPLKLSSRGRVDADKDMLYSGVVGTDFVADETNPVVFTKLFGILVDGYINEFFTTQAEPIAVVAPVEPAVASVKPQ